MQNADDFITPRAAETIVRNHALVNRAKCRSHVYSRCSTTRGFDKPHAGTPMSHAGRGIRDVFHTACGARLYNIPLTVRHGEHRRGI